MFPNSSVKIALSDNKLHIMFLDESKDVGKQVQHRRTFKLSPLGYDSLANAYMDWLTSSILETRYNGEV